MSKNGASVLEIDIMIVSQHGYIHEQEIELIMQELWAQKSETGWTTNHCSSSACVTSILETLETCIDKGKVDPAPVWSRKLKTEWWKHMVKSIIYASSNGSLRAVKYFIDKGQKPHIRYL